MRRRQRAVAYRMLGSLNEADDAVQEAWLRLSRSDAGIIENLGGWLTTVVSRVCLDMLRSRTSRKEEPLDAQVARPRVQTSGRDPYRRFDDHDQRRGGLREPVSAFLYVYVENVDETSLTKRIISSGSEVIIRGVTVGHPAG